MLLDIFNGENGNKNAERYKYNNEAICWNRDMEYLTDENTQLNELNDSI